MKTLKDKQKEELLKEFNNIKKEVEEMLGLDKCDEIIFRKKDLNKIIVLIQMNMYINLMTLMSDYFNNEK